jgi:hypothetical protein
VRCGNPPNPLLLLINPFMYRAIVGIALIVWLGACTQRMVCPAYQSAFIYDKEELRKKFSYFKDDSVPKVYAASKNKYLIAEAMPYRKKVRTMQTVPAKAVAVNVPDSLSGKQSPDSVITADLDKAARSVIEEDSIVSTPAAVDSVQVSEDSVYVISKDREVRVLKYNTPDTAKVDTINNVVVYPKPKYYVKEVGFGSDQDSYMWYLRHSLVLPDVKLAKMQTENKGEKGGSKGGKKKKGLFGKRDRDKQVEDADSAELEILPTEEKFDYIDTTAADTPDQVDTSAPKKKGLLSRDRDETISTDPDASPADKKRARKKKKKQPETTPVKKDEKKKEDEDDGF